MCLFDTCSWRVPLAISSSAPQSFLLQGSSLVTNPNLLWFNKPLISISHHEHKRHCKDKRNQLFSLCLEACTSFEHSVGKPTQTPSISFLYFSFSCIYALRFSRFLLNLIALLWTVAGFSRQAWHIKLGLILQLMPLQIWTERGILCHTDDTVFVHLTQCFCSFCSITIWLEWVTKWMPANYLTFFCQALIPPFPVCKVCQFCPISQDDFES